MPPQDRYGRGLDYANRSVSTENPPPWGHSELECGCNALLLALPSQVAHLGLLCSKFVDNTTVSLLWPSFLGYVVTFAHQSGIKTLRTREFAVTSYPCLHNIS
jgi:hypothetical protein